MKDVNGWLVPDGYDGCRNCAQERRVRELGKRKKEGRIR